MPEQSAIEPMRKLLIVDDDHSVIEMMVDYFFIRGSEVLSAQTSEEAIRVAFLERPDLVLLDLGLPDFSGEEVLKRIKRSMPQMKVIVLTGQTEAGLREKMMKLGSDAYFKKGETSLTEIEKKMHELLV